MTRFIQVVTTVDKQDIAEKIAIHVLDQNLAACVQISTCKSLYRWKGKIENEAEYLCVMKSSEELYPMLEKAIREVHPYDVPEILATQILKGSQEYLSWLDKELQKNISS